MKTIIIEIITEVVCLLGFNSILFGANSKKEQIKNIVVQFDFVKDDKSKILLDRNLNHLELINQLEGYAESGHSKYFSPQFLSELKNSKYEAQMNIINTSRSIVKQAG